MKRSSGAVFLPWLFIVLMIGSLIWLLNRLTVGIQQAESCELRLEELYAHIRLYMSRSRGGCPLQIISGGSVEISGKHCSLL